MRAERLQPSVGRTVSHFPRSSTPVSTAATILKSNAPAKTARQPIRRRRTRTASEDKQSSGGWKELWQQDCAGEEDSEADGPSNQQPPQHACTRQ
eukprot:CAMPEP_0195596876 /NCGR_PEP_ID=MMETSP0815-20121206/2690_1 /TAXON_ID=97485 /ORGANISM="Prymnesium parvum, Strain Texoma1" /LENGTH=94 /DNA_ID=CAMNT_0040736189 /DNA_START=231 /DNA_END=515 /DNA_ORIENTATION=+